MRADIPSETERSMGAKEAVVDKSKGHLIDEG
jgi:hypothetical protein